MPAFAAVQQPNKRVFDLESLFQGQARCVVQQELRGVEIIFADQCRMQPPGLDIVIHITARLGEHAVTHDWLRRLVPQVTYPAYRQLRSTLRTDCVLHAIPALVRSPRAFSRRAIT